MQWSLLTPNHPSSSTTPHPQLLLILNHSSPSTTPHPQPLLSHSSPLTTPHHGKTIHQTLYWNVRVHYQHTIDWGYRQCLHLTGLLGSITCYTYRRTCLSHLHKSAERVTIIEQGLRPPCWLPIVSLRQMQCLHERFLLI